MDEKIALSPAEAMRLALKKARLGTGYVAPNPLVGCTIVDRDHRLLAVGYHRKLGGPHAEIDALSQLASRDLARGAHFYVTLEPCAHQGRTPSCACTLAPLAPASVTYAVKDPNPLVAGKGAEILREAGVRVRLLSDCEEISEAERESLVAEAEDVAEIFLHNHRTHSPFVAVKVGSTLDGQLAFKSGESKWITSELSREHAQTVRARYDGVLVGVETLLKDDPSLNVRHPEFPEHVNRAIILDPHGRSFEFLHKARLRSVRKNESILVVRAPGVQKRPPDGIKIVTVPRTDSGSFAVGELLEKFKEEGLTSVMVEGGARAIGSFFAAKKVNRLHLYQAPILFGGETSVAWSSAFGVTSMADKIQIERCERTGLGSDLYLTGRCRF